MSWFRMAFPKKIIVLGVVPSICLISTLFSQGVFAALRALLVGPRRFPSMPFICSLPLLAALNGMLQGPRDNVKAAWNLLWAVRVLLPLHLVWAMIRLPYRPMTKDCQFLSPYTHTNFSQSRARNEI